MPIPITKKEEITVQQDVIREILYKRAGGCCEKLLPTIPVSRQDFMDELHDVLGKRNGDHMKKIVTPFRKIIMDLPLDNIRNRIFTGDCREVMKKLPSGSVNAICTSPPYYRSRLYGIPPSTYGGLHVHQHEWVEHKYKLSNRHLREMYTKFGKKDADEKVTYYTCDCGAYSGELGQEPTVEMFVRDLAECFDEVYRVLRDDGSCWVNLGYKFKKGGKNAGEYLDIPGLFLQEMRRHGWYCKQIIHWHKPNPMPSSAKRRFCPDHEDIIWFVKDLKKYHFKTQYEPLKHPNAKKPNTGFERQKFKGALEVDPGIFSEKKFIAREHFGKIKRATWTFPTGSYKGSHYAAYPLTLPVIPIDATVPLFQCKACGKPRMPIVEGKSFYSEHKDEMEKQQKYATTEHTRNDAYFLAKNSSEYKKSLKKKQVTGFTVPCNCNAGWEPGIILDNFIGAGTTALTAKKMGRDFIGIEVDPEAREVILKRLQLEAELPLYILPEQMTKQQLQEAGAGLKDFFFDFDEWVEELLAAHD